SRGCADEPAHLCRDLPKSARRWGAGYSHHPISAPKMLAIMKSAIARNSQTIRERRRSSVHRLGLRGSYLTETGSPARYRLRTRFVRPHVLLSHPPKVTRVPVYLRLSTRYSYRILGTRWVRHIGVHSWFRSECRIRPVVEGQLRLRYASQTCQR